MSGLNTVPIVRVLPSKFGSDAAYVHARVAFFVWQMRRTGQAVVPWINSTHTTPCNDGRIGTCIFASLPPHHVWCLVSWSESDGEFGRVDH